MVGYFWSKTYQRVIEGSISLARFLEEVVRSLAQPSWRQRNAQNLVEIDQIFNSLVHLRNKTVGKNDRDFALLQVLIQDVDRFKKFLELYYNKKIQQDKLIEHLDHLADKIRREVVSYEKYGSSAPLIVKLGKVFPSVDKKARVELSGVEKRVSKVLEAGHVTISGKEYGVVRGGNFLVMARNTVFIVEPLDKVGAIVVKRATKVFGGDYLLNPNEDYDCEVSGLIVKLRIVM